MEPVKIRDKNTPAEIKQIKAQAVEFGMRKFGYSQEVANKVGERVEKILKNDFQEKRW
jgi:hypothetical protein